MITESQRNECLKGLKDAYQCLKLYQEMKEEGKIEEGFDQVALSHIESAIYKVAQTFDLDSEIKDQTLKTRKENQKRANRIKDLETELAERAKNQDIEKNIKTIHKQISKKWNEEGFGSSSQFYLNERGKTIVQLNLHPLVDIWELEEEIETEDGEILEKFKTTYEEKGLGDTKSGHYVFVLDIDCNKETLQDTIEKTFPGAEILNWGKSRKENDMFVLDGAEVLISNLSFLEGSK